MLRIGLLTIAFALASCRTAAPPATLVYEVDTALAREVGLASAESEEEIVASVSRHVRRRMNAWDYEPRLVPAVEGKLIKVVLTTPEAREEAEAIDTALRSIGTAELFQLAGPSMDPLLETDLATEQEKLEDWLDEHPPAKVSDINGAPSTDGAHARLAWFPVRPENESQVRLSERERATLVLLPDSPMDAFGATRFEEVYPTVDSLGHDAVGFTVHEAYRPAFGEFTERCRGRFLAIVVGGEVVSAPRVEQRLMGGGIIRGGFTPEEFRRVMRLVKSDRVLRPLSRRGKGGEDG